MPSATTADDERTRKVDRQPGPRSIGRWGARRVGGGGRAPAALAGPGGRSTGGGVGPAGALPRRVSSSRIVARRRCRRRARPRRDGRAAVVYSGAVSGRSVTSRADRGMSAGTRPTSAHRRPGRPDGPSRSASGPSRRVDASAGPRRPAGAPIRGTRRLAASLARGGALRAAEPAAQRLPALLHDRPARGDPDPGAAPAQGADPPGATSRAASCAAASTSSRATSTTCA